MSDGTRGPQPTIAPSRSRFPDLWQDLRYTARILRKQPGFAAAAVLMLALGIGATTSIFAVVNAVVINPLPYRDSHELVRIVHIIGGIEQPYFSDVIYGNYADHAQALQDVGVWSADTVTVTGHGDPEEVPVLEVSRGVLTALGVQPRVGRWFSTADDQPGEPAVALLGHGFWQRRFGGDPGVVGQTLTLNGRPHQIVGVMPQDFRFDDDHDLLLPLRVNRGRPVPGFRLLGVARLKPGVTLDQANADSARVLHAMFEAAGTPAHIRARWLPSIRPLKQVVLGDVGTTLWVLMATIAIVMLMACANVANLVLVRAFGRHQEFAIRAALGAGRARMARQLLVESLMLAALGGALGVGFAYAGLQLLVALGPPNLPRLAEVSLDGTVVAFALTISLLSALLFGLLPMLNHARPGPGQVGGSRTSTLTRERQRSQSGLVAMQVALAVVLLVSAGLMIRSVQALRRVDPGFADPSRMQTFSVSIPPAIVPEAERVMRLQQEMLTRIGAIPGVASVAFVTRLPMGSPRSSAALTVEHRADDGRTPPNRQTKTISPGLFATLGTPIVTGRDFTWTDIHDRRDVAIVSENLARELWGSPEAALGARVREYYDPKTPWREIVGVVGDVYDDGVDRRPPTTIYWPAGDRRVSFTVRTERAGTPSLHDELQQAIWSISPDLPLAEVRTLAEIVERSMARASFTLVMLSIAGAMALLLGVTGLYGVIAYSVRQRRREIGIRLALGAQAADIRTLFLRRALMLVTVGVAIGLAGAVGFTPVMRSLLFGVSPFDPFTFVAMPSALVLAAALATYVPARRAVGVNPVETLRAE